MHPECVAPGKTGISPELGKVSSGDVRFQGSVSTS